MEPSWNLPQTSPDHLEEIGGTLVKTLVEPYLKPPRPPQTTPQPLQNLVEPWWKPCRWWKSGGTLVEPWWNLTSGSPPRSLSGLRPQSSLTQWPVDLSQPDSRRSHPTTQGLFGARFAPGADWFLTKPMKGHVKTAALLAFAFCSMLSGAVPCTPELGLIMPGVWQLLFCCLPLMAVAPVGKSKAKAKAKAKARAKAKAKARAAEPRREEEEPEQAEVFSCLVFGWQVHVEEEARQRLLRQPLQEGVWEGEGRVATGRKQRSNSSKRSGGTAGSLCVIGCRAGLYGHGYVLRPISNGGGWGGSQLSGAQQRRLHSKFTAAGLNICSFFFSPWPFFWKFLLLSRPKPGKLNFVLRFGWKSPCRPLHPSNFFGTGRVSSRGR